jgi:dihydropteroate synthase
MRDVSLGMRAALVRAERAGIRRSQVILDPGIGFGKRYEQNFQLLAHLQEFASLDCPLLVGTSRKAFLGWALAGNGNGHEQPWPVERRQWGVAATVTSAILGGAHIVRVHDVTEMAEVARVTDAIVAAR